jgi:hypothetical protein
MLPIKVTGLTETHTSYHAPMLYIIEQFRKQDKAQKKTWGNHSNEDSYYDILGFTSYKVVGSYHGVAETVGKQEPGYVG